MMTLNGQAQKPSSKQLELYENSLILLEKELLWRQENQRFEFYEPNGVCEQAIRHIGSSSDLVTILSAANGIGKTTLIVNFMANLFWPGRNRYFDIPIVKNWPYPKSIRYITDPKIVEESGPFTAEIKKWWPRGKYESSKLGRNYVCQYKIGDWVLDVMTNDQDLRQFEGGTKGCIIFDEPPKENIWHASISRLRLGGILLVFMTPLTEAAWFFDKVVPTHQDAIFYASMEDACRQHGVRGHLEHDHIQKMLKEMSPDEIEARAYGKAMYLKGLVYKTFNHQVHVLKEPVTPPLNSTIYNVVDPHADKPFFAIWAWPQRNGDLIIFDEHPNEDFFKMHNCPWTREDYQRMYSQKETGYNVKRVIDRHFADVMTAANKKTLRQELGEIGMKYEPSYSTSEEIETGILKVREYLRYDSTRDINSINRPRLYVNPHCLNVIKGFTRWSIDPKTGKYSDDYKDPMDVVRYLVMANPKQYEPLPYTPPVKRFG